jgi:hypothetical protein
METVRIEDVEVVGASDADLLCRIRGRIVRVPSLLVAPSSEVQAVGDRGTLVVERWLAIGLGLVSPFAPAPCCLGS